MSEEVPNPARNIPKAMLLSIAINGPMGVAILIPVLFYMGNLEAALASGPFPITYIFSRITGGNTAAASAANWACASSWSSATAASHAAPAISSTSPNRRAHLCLIAWNDPTVRPNCSRTLT